VTLSRVVTDGAAKRAEGNAEHDAAKAKGYAGTNFPMTSLHRLLLDEPHQRIRLVSW